MCSSLRQRLNLSRQERTMESILSSNHYLGLTYTYISVCIQEREEHNGIFFTALAHHVAHANVRISYLTFVLDFNTLKYNFNLLKPT